jgi:hypothetical protein
MYGLKAHTSQAHTYQPCPDTKPLPTGLNETGDFPPKRQLAEAQAAKTKLAQIGTRPAANFAAIVLAAGKFRLAGVFNSFRCS